MLFADARRSSREEGRALPRSLGEKQGTFRRAQSVLGQRRPRPRPPTPIPGLTRTQATSGQPLGTGSPLNNLVIHARRCGSASAPEVEIHAVAAHEVLLGGVEQDRMFEERPRLPAGCRRGRRAGAHELVAELRANNCGHQLVAPARLSGSCPRLQRTAAACGPSSRSGGR